MIADEERMNKKKLRSLKKRDKSLFILAAASPKTNFSRIFEKNCYHRKPNSLNMLLVRFVTKLNTIKYQGYIQ